MQKIEYLQGHGLKLTKKQQKHLMDNFDDEESIDDPDFFTEEPPKKKKKLNPKKIVEKPLQSQPSQDIQDYYESSKSASDDE